MHTLTKTMSILYFNGMNSVILSRGEMAAINQLLQKGYVIRHIPIDWQSGQSFKSLMEQGLSAVRAGQKKHKDVLLIGASAGGTLVINLMAELQDSNATAISICGRHIDRNLAKWDPRTLKRMAFMTERRASQSFYDAVLSCQDNAIPSLASKTKQQLLCIKPLLDDVVPRSTMNIKGISTYIIPVIGHHRAIVTSLWRLPNILV